MDFHQFFPARAFARANNLQRFEQVPGPVHEQEVFAPLLELNVRSQDRICGRRPEHRCSLVRVVDGI
eukprot:14105031-Heterocapsa_arctica.AAC.1